MPMGPFDSPDFPVHQALPWGKGARGRLLRPPEYRLLPENIFEIEDHQGGVKITGIKQEYFDAEMNTICGNIIIPSMIDGKPVAEIGTFVFRGLPITGVQFPESIGFIREGAFSECKYLREIRCLSRHPIFFGDKAFAETGLTGKIPNLTAIILDGEVPFPPGCVVEQVTFGPTPGIDTVIGDTQQNVVDQLPIYRALPTSPSYYPPTGEPPHYSGTGG